MKQILYIHLPYELQRAAEYTRYEQQKNYRQVPSDSGRNVFFSHSFGQEEDEMTDAERNGALQEINQGRRGFSWVEQKGASTHPPVDPRHVEADHDERFVVQHYDVNGAMNGEEMLARDEESCLATIWKQSVMDRIST